MSNVELTADNVFQHIFDFAVYARNHLHLNFAELDRIANPSFSIIIKYCELSIEILKSEAHNGIEHAQDVMESFQDILTAIIDRDNELLVSCMSRMDDLFENHEVRAFIQ